MSQPGISKLSPEASARLAALFKAVDGVLKDWDLDTQFDGYSAIDNERLTDLDNAWCELCATLIPVNEQRIEPIDWTPPVGTAIPSILDEQPLSPEWHGRPWALNEDEIDLPDVAPPPRADGLPHQLYIGTVQAERHGPTGPFDVDVTVEPRGARVDDDRVLIGLARFSRIEALRLCNFLVRALRRDA